MLMWKTILATALILMAIPSLAQKNKKDINVGLQLFDKNWEPTDASNAKYLIREDKLGDSSYQVLSYNYAGPLLSVKTYADKGKTIPHGFFAWYDARGRADSAGFFYLGKKDSYWRYLNDSLKTTMFEMYQKGTLLSAEDQTKPGIGKEYGDEREAYFEGGELKWRKYLEKNIDFPKRAEALKIKGTIRVSFYVDTDGTLGDLWVEKSVEYSADMESIRIIKKGPSWVPAFQGGKKVKAFRVQPITFHFE
jgi:TonB family protein